MPYKNGNAVWNATDWPEDKITFLKKNYQRFTNKQLAQELGLRLTVTRNKLAELGLKRIEMEYWTDEQKQFLTDHYKTMGDVDIAAVFQKQWPKNKKWTKQHINKKRKYLNLHRTAEEIAAIRTKN